MILLKNTASQVAYSKLINVTTGVTVTGETAVSAYISKDGGAEALASGSITEIGHGIYKITLSQAETNCDIGVINLIHTSNSSYVFETLYFQTTEANPSVNVLQNNDKSGYSLSSSQTFSTTGTIGSVSDPASILSVIKSSTYDGITQEKIYEMILSFMAGKVVITTIDANTRNISYKKRDGVTEKFNITVSSADGARSSGGTIT